jgi:dihydrofolate reductase
MSTSSRRVVLVAAVADNGVIGNGPDIPWHLPGEQRLFKELTWGHVLVMGRKTFESIGRPLPGRSTVVLTRDPSWRADGVLVADSVGAALEAVHGLPGDAMVVGGAQVYAQAMFTADQQVLTRVPLSPPGDVHYPPYDEADWVLERRETFDGFTREWLQRRRPEVDVGREV